MMGKPEEVLPTESPDNRIVTDVQGLQYTVEERPPWFLCIMLGFQHYISMFVATLTIPFLLAPKICMDEDHVGKSHVIGTLFVCSGLITLLQNLFGCRLPIVQAGTFALLSPTLAYFSLPQWECPVIGMPKDYNATTMPNLTYIEVGSPEHREVWMERLRVVQGSLMIAALFELVLGLTGAIGGLLRFIGPLSICPTVSLLGLSLFRSAADYGSQQWWICFLTVALMILFSQYLGRINIPCFSYSRAEKCSLKGYPIFKMFPVILSMMITWLLCFVLTVTNVFPEEEDGWGYGARTDTRSTVIAESPWVRFPYPGQWGVPTVSVACLVGLMAGIIATMVESVGDYTACAKLSGAPVPPHHAINRGILVEGLGSLLDGLFGTGNGTTSTSVNVGVIGITKVGSRAVVMVSAMFMIVLGVFNKFGALFVTVPDPIIGGSFIILFGMIVAVGISNLQYVDLNSSRNLFIIGFSFLIGLTVPEWVKEHPESIRTGSDMVDSAVTVLLSMSMFVGGLSGFILDNTIPGTEDERGMSHWRKMRELQDESQSTKDLEKRLRAVYDLPFGMSYIRRYNFLRYIPICPTFGNKHAQSHAEENNFLSEESIRIDVTQI